MQPRNNNNGTNNNKNRMMRNNNTNNNKHRHGRNNNQSRTGGSGGNNGQNRPRININQATNQRDKFQNQARDAMHHGDRVLSEYYLQHADHYQRLINEYNEEQESRRQQITETQAESGNQPQGEMMADAEVGDIPMDDATAAPSIAAILPAAIPLDTDDLEPLADER